MHFQLLIVAIFAASISMLPTISVQSTMYMEIISKCPIFKDDDFKKQDIMKKCTNWAAMKSVTALTRDTEDAVLCLLYYNNFVAYCHGKQSVENLSYIQNFTIDKVCANFPPKVQVEEVVIPINASMCAKLCDDYVGGVLMSCRLVQYFYNLTTFQALKPSNTKHNLTSLKQKNVENQNVAPVGKTEINLVHSNHPVGEVVKPANKVSAKKNVEKPQEVQIVLDEPEAHVNAPPVGNVDPKPVVIAPPRPDVDEKQEKLPETQQVKTDDNNHAAVETQLTQVKEIKSKIVADHDPVSVDLLEKSTKKVSGNKEIEVVSADTADVADKNKLMEEKTKAADDAGRLPSAELPAQGPEEEQVVEDYNSEDPVEKKPEAKHEEKKEKPDLLEDEPVSHATEMDGDSYFFSYFMVTCIVFILGYVGYHNRQKIMALLLEGKRGKRQYRGRRPNSANYHKLDSNLEEAISSTCSKNTTSHVIY